MGDDVVEMGDAAEMASEAGMVGVVETVSAEEKAGAADARDRA